MRAKLVGLWMLVVGIGLLSCAAAPPPEPEPLITYGLDDPATPSWDIEVVDGDALGTIDNPDWAPVIWGVHSVDLPGERVLLWIKHLHRDEWHGNRFSQVIVDLNDRTIGTLGAPFVVGRSGEREDRFIEGFRWHASPEIPTRMVTGCRGGHHYLVDFDHMRATRIASDPDPDPTEEFAFADNQIHRDGRRLLLARHHALFDEEASPHGDRSYREAIGEHVRPLVLDMPTGVATEGPDLFPPFNARRYI